MIHVPHYAECRVVLMRLRVLAQQRWALADCASDPARFLMHTNAEPRPARFVSFRFVSVSASCWFQVAPRVGPTQEYNETINSETEQAPYERRTEDSRDGTCTF